MQTADGACQQSEQEKGATANLACGAYKQYGSSKCTNHFIDYDTLYSIVLRSVQNMLCLSADTEDAIIREAAGRLNKKDNSPNKKVIGELKNRKAELDILIENLYEDHAKQLISTERMHKMLRKYESESNTIDIKLNSLIEETNDIKQSYDSNSKLRKILKNYTEIKELTPDLLYRLIDHIEVCQGAYTKTEQGQVKKQTVKIFYRFSGSPYIETYTI